MEYLCGCWYAELHTHRDFNNNIPFLNAYLYQDLCLCSRAQTKMLPDSLPTQIQKRDFGDRTKILCESVTKSLHKMEKQ